jgi:L-2-hydroxyglutarate oxidase LhgO
MPFDVDIIIIGAGVVGLAIAAELAREKRAVFILEKNETFGRETSSRNSGTIHTGIMSPSGSLNSRLCLAGNPLIYEICDKYGVNYRKTGKLIVACNASEVAELEAFYQRKVEGIEMRRLSKNGLMKLEPEVSGEVALLFPEAGVVDVWDLMRCFLGMAAEKGANLVCKTEVTAIEKAGESYRVHYLDSDGAGSLKTRVVINCAGLNADKVAAMAGIDIKEKGLHHSFFKGEYYSVCPDKAGRIKKWLVYPVPRSGGVTGIHSVLDVDGRVRLGPDFYPVDKIEYSIDDSRKKIFYKGIKKLFPFIDPEDIEPESAGIMPRIYDVKEKFIEFRICNEIEKGLNGFINLEGIGSPGLTASPAIARYVSKSVEKILND